jgi:hypothetical protein
MPDLWFALGLAIGVAVTGFCAVGSFERGAESVRRAPWHRELSERKRATFLASRRSVFTIPAPMDVGVVASAPVVEEARPPRAELPVFEPA